MNNSKNTHLALTQYYRWYQVYEIPFTKSTIENQLDILSDQVEISSQAGTTKGKDTLADRLQLFEGWKNAHHVKSTKISQSQSEKNTLELEAKILYQNIRPDNSRYSYTISYSTLLELRDNDLPLFKSVVITPIENIEDPQFEPAYLDNRVKSFLHYWLYLLETIRDQDHSLRFKELVHQDFSISKDSSNTANKMDALQSWINTIIPEKGEYTLCFENLTIQEKQDLSIDISFDLKTNNTPNNQTITKQTWLLKNNTDHRFAQLKTVL